MTHKYPQRGEIVYQVEIYDPNHTYMGSHTTIEYFSFLPTRKGTIVRDGCHDLLITKTAITNEYIWLLANYLACRKFNKKEPRNLSANIRVKRVR